MADHATVIRVTHIRPLPGKHDELVKRSSSTVAAMRSADGCFGVQVCNVRETPGIIAVVSRWVNQAALDAVVNAGIFNPDNVKDLLAGPPTTEHLLAFAGGRGDDDD